MSDRRTCVHFMGALRRCRAGFEVEALRDDELRLPCQEIQGVAGERPCQSLQWPPAEQPQLSGAMERALDALSKGACPNCGGPIQKEIGIGGKVLASPCRHLLMKETRNERS